MTNYYVQTIETSFPHEWGKNAGTGEKAIDSTNNILTSFLKDGKDDNGLTPHIRTKDGYTLSYGGQRIYHLSGSVYPSSFPTGKESEAFHSNVVGDAYFTWWDKRLDNYSGFWGLGWENTYSWTDPDSNYATWLQEVVYFIDNLKDSMSEWGEDNDEINIYIF